MSRIGDQYEMSIHRAFQELGAVQSFIDALQWTGERLIAPVDALNEDERAIQARMEMLSSGRTSGDGGFAAEEIVAMLVRSAPECTLDVDASSFARGLATLIEAALPSIAEEERSRLAQALSDMLKQEDAASVFLALAEMVHFCQRIAPPCYRFIVDFDARTGKWEIGWRADAAMIAIALAKQCCVAAARQTPYEPMDRGGAVAGASALDEHSEDASGANLGGKASTMPLTRLGGVCDGLLLWDAAPRRRGRIARSDD